jgi:hypothetical protein
MGRMTIFRAWAEAEQAEPSGQTVINGVPYDADKAIRSGAENGAASVNPDAQIAKEIKRRQVSLAVRYIAALRAR